MTLCACMGRRELALVSSQVRVTSKKSDSARSSRKAPETFDSKSFQRRQKFSEEPILMSSHSAGGVGKGGSGGVAS